MSSARTKLSRRSSSEGSRHRRESRSVFTLEVLCIKARGLMASDMGGTSDPFVKLYYLGGIASPRHGVSGAARQMFGKTRSIPKSLNPHWGEKFHLTIPSRDLISTDGLGHLGPIYIVCEVWDKDTLSADDLLGRCRVPAPATKSSVEKRWYQLSHPKLPPKGQICISATWYTSAPGQHNLSFDKLIPGEFPAHRFLHCVVTPRKSTSPLLQIRIPPADEKILYFIDGAIYQPQFPGALYISDYRLLFVPYEWLDYKRRKTRQRRSTTITKHLFSVSRAEVKKKKKLAVDFKDAGNVTFHCPGTPDVILKNICNEINWRREEGPSAFSICEPLLQEYRGVKRSLANDMSVKPKSNVAAAVAASPPNFPTAFSFPHCVRRLNVLRSPQNQIDLHETSLVVRLLMQREFRRQGLLKMSGTWIVADVNTDYHLCETYPSVLCFPASFPRQSLVAAARHRSRSRLPTLTWIHPVTCAALCRSSQPRSGFTQSARLQEDVELLNAIRNTKAGRHTTKLHIFDARPKINADANGLKGKGYENISHLGGKNLASLQFCNIGNIHVMRHSFSEMMKAATSNTNSYLDAVNRSKWINHVSQILRASVQIAKVIHIEGEPCLVHCSDGWDRTSQLCATAQLLVDPYFRTIEGFGVLVEKDFCAFGHKFHDRCGSYGRKHVENEGSPVFLQWLDVVHQILNQQPHAFEFDQNLLLFLASACYSGEFGTFLYNSEKERTEHGVYMDTLSVWDFIDSHVADFKSSIYVAWNFEENEHEILHIEPQPAFLLIWRGLFQPFSIHGPRNAPWFISPPPPLADSAAERTLQEKEIQYAQEIHQRLYRAFGMEKAQYSHDSKTKLPRSPDENGLDKKLEHSGSTDSQAVTYRLRHQSEFDVTVTSYTVIHEANGKRFGAYLVRVEQHAPNHATWSFHRRFSDFTWLHEKLIDFDLSPPNLPNKTLFRNFSRKFLERRREELDVWCAVLPRFIGSELAAPAIYNFLDATRTAGGPF